MISVHGGTDIGLVKTNNEDSWSVRNLSDSDDLVLIVVSDGVGGHAFGEVASQTTMEVFLELADSGKLDPASDPSIREMLLTMAAQKAHVEVSRIAVENEDKRGMACTLTAAIADNDSLSLVQIGDSRLYQYSNGNLQQLSQDQTVANALLIAGRITQEQFQTHPDRGTLSQSIGLEAIDNPFQPVTSTHEWQSGDRLLACTDGLTDMLEDSEIIAILKGTKSLRIITQQLIAAALEAGGRDNVTVVMAGNEQY